MRAVQAEWTKLRTTPGTGWLLLVTAVVTVALGAAVSAAASCSQSGCGIEATRLMLSGVYVGQAPVAVLGVLAVCGEYSTGLIHITLAAVPDRSAVLAAKALVLAVLVAVVGSLTLLVSVLVAGLVLRRSGFVPQHGWIADSAVLRAVALVLVVVLSIGVGAVVRDSAVAIGSVLGLLYLPPILTQLVAAPHLHRLLEQLAPMTGGLVALAAWSAAMLLAGMVLLRLRDA